MAQLSGQVALVTGASAPKGIGRAIAKRLAKEGAHVIVSDLGGSVAGKDESLKRMDLLEELAAGIRSNHGHATALELDVTNADSIAVAMTRIRDSLDGVDILVNNAGSLAGSADFLTTTPDQWQTSFAVNLMGPVRLAQAVLPYMQDKGAGRIINIGSTGSLGAEPGFGAYTAMKHALVGFTKTLAAEFGPQGIRCNTVCPGFIATDMHEAANTRLAGEQGLTVGQIKAQRYANVALRDAGTPEDVAEAVAYLAGPGGAYVTGINFPVAGGVPCGI